MSTEPRPRAGQPRRSRNRLLRWVVEGLWPNQHLRWTREGIFYLGVWVGLLVVGLYQQINLILLVAGLAAGPVVASVFVSASMLRRLRVSRRVPAYVFSGDPLRLDYTLQNDRRWTAALGAGPESPRRAHTGRPDALRRGRRSAPCLLPAGPGARSREDPLGRPEPAPRSLRVPQPRPRHAFAIRAFRAQRHDRVERGTDRLPDDRISHEALAPRRARGERDPPRPAARAGDHAAGVPRPPRLPPRRQPPVDPLADLRPPRPADGQGIRAAA